MLKSSTNAARSLQPARALLRTRCFLQDQINRRLTVFLPIASPRRAALRCIYHSRDSLGVERLNCGRFEMSEHRRFQRVRPSGLISKTGTIFVDLKSPPVVCDIVDLSAGGACLEVHGSEAIPKKFVLNHGGVKKPAGLFGKRHAASACVSSSRWRQRIERPNPSVTRPGNWRRITALESRCSGARDWAAPRRSP